MVGEVELVGGSAEVEKVLRYGFGGSGEGQFLRGICPWKGTPPDAKLLPLKI